MNTLDYLREAGRKEEGQKVKSEVEKNLLSANRFTTAEIANFANVSEAFVFEVKAMIMM